MARPKTTDSSQKPKAGVREKKTDTGETPAKPAKAAPKNKLNDLTAREWTLHSKSVITSKDVSSERSQHHIEHGATFPEALAGRFIEMYTKKGDTVMDPFSGVSDTLLACNRLGRRGIGFEIYERFYDISKSLLMQETLDGSLGSKIINQDCRTLEKYVKPGQIQLTFTSPPYADFIQQSMLDRKTTHKKSKLVDENNSSVNQYGTNPADFGNLEYGEFIENVGDLMAKIYRVTKPNGYNIWVVKDHRIAKKKIPYVPVHSDIANAGVEAGFTNHDLVVWDQNDQRSLVVLGYPTVFYVNVNHTFLVVLRKNE